MKDDTISRAAAIDAMMKLQAEDIEAYGALIPEGFDGDRAVTAIKALPPAQPEEPEVTITYQICVASMLKMWMDDVLTDSEYRRIMNKLNTWYLTKGCQEE